MRNVLKAKIDKAQLALQTMNQDKESEVPKQILAPAVTTNNLKLVEERHETQVFQKAHENAILIDERQKKIAEKNETKGSI